MSSAVCVCVVSALVLLTLSSCIGASKAVSDPGRPSLASVLEACTFVDLTHSFDSRTLYWPTSPCGFTLTPVHIGPSPGGYYYSAYTFSAPEHGGTHFDAPAHFAVEGITVEKVPLRTLSGPACVIDVTASAERDPDHRLTVAEVEAWESWNGRIPAGAIVLVRTGWAKRWPDKRAFLGDDTPGDATRLHFPGYGAESARLLAEERRVAIIGIDTASIDHGPSRDFVVHRVAMAAGLCALENVANLELLPETGAWVVALPMKIVGGSGAPARIVAILRNGEGSEAAIAERRAVR